MPQPYLVPVSPAFSLIAQSSGVSASTSRSVVLPLIVRFAIAFPWLSPIHREDFRAKLYWKSTMVQNQDSALAEWKIIDRLVFDVFRGGGFLISSRCAAGVGKRKRPGWLAMTWIRLRILAACYARVSAGRSALSNQRAQGMPDARCARRRMCNG